MLRLQAPLPDRYTLASADELDAWIADAKRELGDRLLILGHHYQRDEVIKWADARGDSFKLARFAADNDRATDIVFCGVHFMAESADVLTADHQRVILPDLNAGCSMADMADIDQVEECWDDAGRRHRRQPDRADHLHELVGRAEGVRRRARRRGVHVVERPGRPRLGARPRAPRSSSSPTSTSGATPVSTWATRRADMRVWNPRFELGGLEERDVKEATFLLWKGHCSVHQRFRPEHVAAFRAEHPDGEVIVHPECAHDVVELADRVGSTERILDWVEQAPAGSVLGIGTEIHMVQRMADEHPDLTIVSLDPLVCPCSTMFRIDGPHLAWVLESLVARRGREPDHRRSAHQRVGPRRAPADARHHLTAAELLERCRQRWRTTAAE